MTPLVSICVPNLNTFPFLEERFETIFRQTFQDWELFVYDSHSDDGSWEFIQELAQNNKRMRIAQGPRQGPYPAWNECLRQTTGDYVYIATSDDSMAPDFLEKMVAALEQHRDCELAHCPLVIVDERGQRVANQSWPQCTVFADGIGELVDAPHLRRAPYDGLLQLTGRHTVFSITQLLIRRSIFSRIGNFPNRWGSVSDFNWEMKAGLVANSVYVPNTWATWRLHSTQASATVNVTSLEHARKFDEMVDDAITACETHLPVPIRTALKGHFFQRANDMRTYYAALRQRRESAIRRRLFQLSQMLGGSMAVRSEILGRLAGRTKWTDGFAVELRKWLEGIGLQPLTPCSAVSIQQKPHAKLQSREESEASDVIPPPGSITARSN